MSGKDPLPLLPSASSKGTSTMDAKYFDTLQVPWEHPTCEDCAFRRMTRATVAKTIAAAREGVLKGRRVVLGFAGQTGFVGRNTVQTEYIDALARSKVVVTCSPDLYEGDSRLGEALASGAAVLVERMADPPPGVVDGHSVLMYNSSADLLLLLRIEKQRPPAS